jgi:hypothetical protein
MRRINTLLCAPVLLLFLLGGQIVHAQKKIKTENLPNFDLRPFHFGFLLSYNTADFFVKLKPSHQFAPYSDSLLVVDHIRQPGFNLGIVSSFNMTPNVSLRFILTLSFQDRVFNYRFRTSDSTVVGFDKRWRALGSSSRSCSNCAATASTTSRSMWSLVASSALTWPARRT